MNRFNLSRRSNFGIKFLFIRPFVISFTSRIVPNFRTYSNGAISLSPARSIGFVAWTLFSILFFFEARADQGESVSLESIYYIYPAKTDATGPKDHPARNIDAEAGFRYYKSLWFTLTFSHFAEPLPPDTGEIQKHIRGTGIGFKYDLPGFFFLFPKTARRSSTVKKNYPINTFFFANAYRYDVYDTVADYNLRNTASRIGIGIDFFLLSNYSYITFKVTQLKMLSDSHLSYGIGLGVSN